MDPDDYRDLTLTAQADDTTTPPAPTVTITQKEYDSLLEDARMLAALESAGVDNWDGYYIACQEAHDDEE